MSSKNVMTSLYGYPLPKIFSQSKSKPTDFMIGVGYASSDQTPIPKTFSTHSTPKRPSYPCGYRSIM